MCLRCSPPDRAPRPPACSPPWLELPGAAERLAAWSEVSGLDLARLGTTATAEEITDTAVTQPLVVAADTAGPRGTDQARPARRWRDRRRRTLRRRDRRLRHRGRDLGRRRRQAGRHPRLGDGQGLRGGANRHVRGARRRRGRGARPPRRAGPGAGQPQRRRSDRRRRCVVSSRQTGRGSAGQGPGPPAGHRGRLPHPLHGVGARTPYAAAAKSVATSRTAPRRCCPTPTVSRWPRPRTR